MSCVFAGTGNGACRGRRQEHHVVPQNRLKSTFKHGAVAIERAWWTTGPTTATVYIPAPYFVKDDEVDVSLRAILDDRRNIVTACVEHHLGGLETGKLQLPVSHLPRDFDDFVREYGLWHKLPRALQEDAEAIVYILGAAAA